MENIPFDLSSPPRSPFALDLPDRPYSPVPLHGFSSEPEQYRLSVQQYRNCPPEFKVQRICFDRDLESYERAAAAGLSRVSRRRGPRIAPVGPRSEESIETAQRRAKIRVRQVVNELAPNHFTTFTTREVGPVFLSPAEWREMWARFVRLVGLAGIEFEYCAVLERHPSNPQHLHLHVAWRGHARYEVLRRLWHIAISHQMGLDSRSVKRGEHSPGNIQDKPVKAPRGSFKQIRKISKYISKYITKDLITEFNKKRYWVSRGVSVMAARLFWLKGLSQGEAVKEACQLLGEWDYEHGLIPQDYFRPSDRVFWCQIDPAKSPPPF